MLKPKKVSLCSSKNLLWVAAFFFNKLKKAQIMDSDISEFVDKIMHHEMDAVSYRVLAYLLLGVVKIYSKRVEYLLDDCNNMLSGINKFRVNTKNNTPVEAVMSIIMPDTFELDALDLGALEDTSKYHTVPPEQITLKEVLSSAGGFAQFSQERFEDFGFGETSGTLDHLKKADDHNSAMETLRSICEMYQEIVNTDEAITFPQSTESSQDDESYQQLGFINEGFVDEHYIDKNLAFQQKVSIEDGKSRTIPSESGTIHETPQSKFHGGSIAQPKRGATTSEVTVIPTPDANECAHFSKRRKIVIDEVTILSNEIMRKRILDASDIVSVRRPLLVSLIDKQRKAQKFSFLKRLNEPLFPCHSPKLQSLLSNKKIKIPNSLRIGENLQKSDVIESQTVGIPEHIKIGLEILPKCPDSLGNEETPGKLDDFESQTCGSSEHISTAPVTPPLCPMINVRSFKRPERTEIQTSDSLGPSSPHESIEMEQSLEMSDNMAEEFNAEDSNSYEIFEKEHNFTMDKDLNLINEGINSSETENSKMFGWSERTRKVATYLQKSFPKVADSVNLSKVSEGRTQKESARLFYEILVLKTTNYVDVQQKDAYGDIEVRKLAKFDKLFGV